MKFLKQSTAWTDTVGPILDSTGAEYTSAVIGDLSISKNGTEAAMAAAATLTHISNGHYTLVGTTGNSDTLGRLTIRCNKAGYQLPLHEFMVLPATVYDALVTNATNSTGGLLGATATVSAVAGYVGASGAAINGTNVNTLSSHDPGATLGTSTLTQAQVTGGAYTVQSSSCVLGDARIANLDATVSSRGTSTLTQTQVTGGAYTIQSSSCVLGDARIANLDAAVSTRGTSTLTQTQVTGGAYALNDASFSFASGLDFTTTQKTSLNAATPTASLSTATIQKIAREMYGVYGTVWHVHPSGNDTTGDGLSWATAYATCSKAASVGAAGDLITPAGDIVETSRINLRAGGTGRGISIVAANGGRAKITNATSAAIITPGTGTRLKGLEIVGTLNGFQYPISVQEDDMDTAATDVIIEDCYGNHDTDFIYCDVAGCDRWDIQGRFVTKWDTIIGLGSGCVVRDSDITVTGPSAVSTGQPCTAVGACSDITVIRSRLRVSGSTTSNVGVRVNTGTARVIDCEITTSGTGAYDLANTSGTLVDQGGNRGSGTRGALVTSGTITTRSNEPANFAATSITSGGLVALADGSIATATFAAGATLPRVTLVDTVTTVTNQLTAAAVANGVFLADMATVEGAGTPATYSLYAAVMGGLRWSRTSSAFVVKNTGGTTFHSYALTEDDTLNPAATLA